MEDLSLAYAGYLGRVDAILDTRGYALQSQDLSYNWQADFKAGIAPAQAVENALAGVIDAGALARAHIERLESALRATIVAIDAITEDEISYGECRYCGATQHPVDESGKPISDDNTEPYCYAINHDADCPSVVLDNLYGTVRAALTAQADEELR